MILLLKNDSHLKALNSIHGQMSKGGQSSGQQVKPDMTDNLLGLLQKAESRSHNLFEGNFTHFLCKFQLLRCSDAER